MLNTTYPELLRPMREAVFAELLSQIVDNYQVQGDRILHQWALYGMYDNHGRVDYSLC